MPDPIVGAAGAANILKALSTAVDGGIFSHYRSSSSQRGALLDALTDAVGDRPVKYSSSFPARGITRDSGRMRPRFRGYRDARRVVASDMILAIENPYSVVASLDLAEEDEAREASEGSTASEQAGGPLSTEPRLDAAGDFGEFAKQLVERLSSESGIDRYRSALVALLAGSAAKHLRGPTAPQWQAVLPSATDNIAKRHSTLDSWAEHTAGSVVESIQADNRLRSFVTHISSLDQPSDDGQIISAMKVEAMARVAGAAELVAMSLAWTAGAAILAVAIDLANVADVSSWITTAIDRVLD